MTNTARWTVAALAALALMIPTLNASADTWTGWISDSHCGAGGAKAGHAACAKKCKEGGSSFVFVNNADKKVYKVDKEDLAGQNLDYEVTVTGKLEGDVIKVESITKKAA